MKRMYIVCNQCGYEERQDIYEKEEAEQKNLRLVPPKCNKCGSMDVKVTN